MLLRETLFAAGIRECELKQGGRWALPGVGTCGSWVPGVAGHRAEGSPEPAFLGTKNQRGRGEGAGVSAASVLLLDQKERKFAAPLPVCLPRGRPQACRLRWLFLFVRSCR